MASVAKLSLTVLEGRSAPGAVLHLDFSGWQPGPEWSYFTGPLIADLRAVASEAEIAGAVRDVLWPLGFNVDVTDASPAAPVPLEATAVVGYAADHLQGVSGLSIGPLGQGGATSPVAEFHTSVIFSATLPTWQSVAGTILHEAGRQFGLGDFPGTFLTVTGDPAVGRPNGVFLPWQVAVIERTLGDPGPASAVEVTLDCANWLHRQASDADWSAWQATGLGPRAVERDIALSPAAFFAAVATPGADWVGTLYQRQTGRGPDPAGYAACYEVAARVGWAVVYADVAGSPEAARHAPPGG